MWRLLSSFPTVTPTRWEEKDDVKVAEKKGKPVEL
jgi:hypothetical protein